MLHEFLRAHRPELIDRCKAAVTRRFKHKAGPTGRDYGTPRFLEQVIAALQLEHSVASLRDRVDRSGALRARGDGHREVNTAEIAVTARQCGLTLSSDGFTLAQIVHNYGDLFLAITNLAEETQTAITVSEFRTLNCCLENAIAGAVTEFSYQRDAVLAEKHLRVSDERARVLLESLQSHVETASLAIAAIAAGEVGLKGATGTILGVSLASMRTLIERSLAEAKESIGLLSRH